MGNSDGLRANTHVPKHACMLTNNEVGSERGMDRAYATFWGFRRFLVVLQLPGARGLNLIKGFASLEWEQG